MGCIGIRKTIVLTRYFRIINLVISWSNIVIIGLLGGGNMMLSLDIGSREYEISGLKPMEVRMYDLAWNHNSDCLGFAGLCDLWFK